MILDDSRKRIERTKDNELENAFKDYGDEQTNNEWHQVTGIFFPPVGGLHIQFIQTNPCLNSLRFVSLLHLVFLMFLH